MLGSRYFSYGAGTNHLKGGYDGEILVAGPGDDTLEGGGGADILLGGNGNDTYSFKTAFSVNHRAMIIDREGASDRVFIADGDRPVVKLDGYNVNITISNKGAVGTLVIQNGNPYGDYPSGGASPVEYLDWKFESKTIQQWLSLLVTTDPFASAVVSSGAGLITNHALSTVAVDTNLGSGLQVFFAPLTDWFASLLPFDAAPSTNAAATAGDPDDGSIIGRQQTISGFVDVIGTEFNDRITGDAWGNYLEGGGGNDLVRGAGGDDILVGGNGAGDDYYDGGEGTDTLVYTSATLGIVVNLAASANQGIGTEIGTDQIKDVENVTAGDGDNTLTGTTMANTLSGGGGNDSITGGGGADTLLGGADDDVLRVPDTTFQVVDGGSGADVLQLTGANLVLNLSALRANEDETPTPR